MSGETSGAPLRLSIKGYARYRGCSRPAVQKAIKTGRIALGDDGLIDVTAADAAWELNTDPATARARLVKPTAESKPEGNHPKPAAEQPVKPEKAPKGNRPVVPAPIAAPRPAADQVNEIAVKRGQAATFAAARAENESLKARERRLRLEEREGKLVDRERAKTLFFDMARQFRDALQGQPARVAAEMAATLGTDPHRVQSELERFVRQFLTELADPSFDLGRAK